MIPAISSSQSQEVDSTQHIIIECEILLTKFLKLKFPLITTIPCGEVQYHKGNDKCHTFNYQSSTYWVFWKNNQAEIEDPLFEALGEITVEMKDVILREVKLDLKEELNTFQYVQITSKNKSKTKFSVPLTKVFEIKFNANGRDFIYHLESNCHYLGKGICRFNHLEPSFFKTLKEAPICPAYINQIALDVFKESVAGKKFSESDFKLISGDQEYFSFSEIPEHSREIGLLFPNPLFGWKLYFETTFTGFPMNYTVNIILAEYGRSFSFIKLLPTPSIA